MNIIRLFFVLGLLLASAVSYAQGFVPDGDSGGEPAEGDGSVEGILGDLLGLIQDFSWDEIPNFACDVATAADEGGETQGAACGLAGLFEDVEKLSENYEETLHTWGTDIFVEFASKNLGLGSYVTNEQLNGYITRINNVLEESREGDNPNPNVIVEEFVAIARDQAEAENENYAQAPEGSVEHTFNEIMNKSPAVKAQHEANQNEKVEIVARQGQSLTNVRGSSRIAEEQAKSQLQEDHNEVVQEIAPEIADEAQSAVSTRATLQELVNGFTIYMQQDAQQFAMLSEQLAIQTQQQVYLTNELHLMTQSLLEERLNEITAKQYAIKNALETNITKYENASDRMVTMGGSFVVAGNTPADLDLSLFNY